MAYCSNCGKLISLNDALVNSPNCTHGSLESLHEVKPIRPIREKQKDQDENQKKD